jgi:hypothetical protein
LVLDSYAIWSPTRSEVNLAGMKLFGSSASPNAQVYSTEGTSSTSPLVSNFSINGSSAISSVLNNLSINNSGINNSLINASMINISANNASSIKAEPSSSSIPAQIGVDLSRYASNRLNKNLTSYVNVPYPMTGSRGSTSTTAGGGGGCCGGG